MTITDYLNNINTRYKTGITTEHSFRGDLQQLIESTVAGILATNEPSHIACGAPDYVLTRKNIPIGYIEAKDIDADLKDKNYKEQFDRYRNSLTNLLFTDYLDFHFYKNGEFVSSIRIAHTEGKKIVPNTDKLEEFIALLKDFCTYTGQTIKSSKTLAEMMAGKARMLANVIENALHSDEKTANNSTLNEQLNAFKDILIHDIKAKEFADIYAQTIAYGMFAARLHDTTLDNFSRQEAAELIPKSNPFLRKLFGYIAGPDIDDRIVWIVDALADIFRATDIKELLKNFGRATQQQDPIIHFYETFLAEYDPKLRKARGVWYTPEPVVNFIVRAVDDILKTEFNLPEGLADRSKTKVKIKTFTKATADQRSKVKEGETEIEVHKVQILDPATGTGTFLAEVIKQIHTKFEGQQGLWSNYVEEHLIPRLNGFELLMASYAMAHLKLDLLLTETGYKPKNQNRLKVYLTNSLEEHHPDTGTLFGNILANEANEANHIKRDTPVMVIIGNPPYLGESKNKGEWIMKLMEDYKKEPGGKERLKERNPKWVNADEIKFIRFSQHFIEKNGSGIMAFINTHSFLDNPTFRGIRWNLLKTFDKIYILDLHGNSIKKEKSPDGSIDQNVFDIQPGVSINIFVKTGKKKANALGEVFHFDLFGKRDFKYEFLFNNTLNTVGYKELPNIAPMYYMVQKDFNVESEYNAGFRIDDLIVEQSMGITSGNDAELTSFDKEELLKKYNKNDIKTLDYRTFDRRYIYYQPKLLARARFQFMKHFFESNIAICLIRRSRSSEFILPFIIKDIVDKCIISTLDNANIFPLYLYPSTTSQTTLEEKQERTPNLNKEIVEKIATGLGLQWVAEGTRTPTPLTQTTFAPLDILDYIYAVLHSPAYREKYKEFLKIDFPRVPYPKDKETFWQLVTLGSQLRQLHLLESPAVNKPITQYPVDGDNKVGKIKYEAALNSPPSEGCPQDGVVLNNSSYPQSGTTINDTYIKFVPILELPYNPNLKQRAKELRQAENLPEVLFWTQVTKARFHNIDFDRQRVIGNYIVDFYIKKLGLVIEIDGKSHDGKEEYDAQREEYLISLGLKVYRIQVNDVMKNMKYVLKALENYIVEMYGVLEEPPRLSGTPPKEGNLRAESIEVSLGKVWINETQYFDKVPPTAWEFYIGGYQPAQKWLKDRKDRILTFDDILHYQKIIVALSETDRLMKEVDKVGVE